MTSQRAPSISVHATPRPLRRPAFDALQVPAAVPSPHFSANKRQSLYAIEDRVVLDPGSSQWKVGFSGEGKPRDVFPACKPTSFLAPREAERTSLWDLDMGWGEQKYESERALTQRLIDRLRKVFFQTLMIDPKSRKVVIIENPLLPICVKDMMARILFQNLQVPSISFAPSGQVALLAAGRTTGLVLDIGHLETTVIPIYCSRPLYTCIRSTPIAGARLTSHLRDLLLMFGGYYPPADLKALPSQAAAGMVSVPESVLTDEVVEDIKVRCCFVDGPISPSAGHATAAPALPSQQSDMDVDTLPNAPSDLDITMFGPSESAELDVTQQPAEASTSRSDSPAPSETHPTHLHALRALYASNSFCTDIHVPLRNRGTLFVPSWVRSRAAELLFIPGDVDESSVPEILLECLQRSPKDIKKELAGSILVIGGTASMRGLIGRLLEEITGTLARPASQDPRDKDRWLGIRDLRNDFSIINHPSPEAPLRGRERAPAWSPGCMAWVGGSLAGALKITQSEIVRERYDEADAVTRQPNDSEEEDGMEVDVTRRGGYMLPDWTRIALPEGAPNAAAPPPALRAMAARG